MKKKNKTIFLVILVLIIITIAIGIILKIKTNNKHMLKEVYNKLNESTTYVFTGEKDSKNKTIVTKDGDKTAIDSYTNGVHTTTIVDNNQMTYILHDREEYYVYNQNNIEKNILTDWIKETINKEYVTGKEKVKGRKYSYEEYSGGTMFMESNALYLKEEDIKTRFYFDKDYNLVYIKTIYGENNEELLKISISNEVNDSTFKIPSTYKNYTQN